MKYINKYKKFIFITAVILCVSLMILTAMYRERPSMVEDAMAFVLVPVKRLTTNVSRWAEDRIVFLVNIHTLDIENARLRTENTELLTENARLRLLERENITLNELLNLSQKFPEHDSIGAEIIAKDPGNWYANFVIDKGRNEGLKRNMVVLAPGGLVGRIIESGANFSKVRALIDDTQAVSAKSLRTGDLGIVRGDMKLMSEGLCRMDLIDIDAEIIIGDEIITSNLGEIYPPGLSIGHVIEINEDAGGLTKHAIIQPSVNFRSLETVLVINRLFVRELLEYE